ncbi:hypothetical protein N473_21740 [Pseudoalteromonas luteoviolacea CPMOR-1]|uniref:Uncharacterized protein n=1 Tax=Pseudoalteromonas luteoviolacea CPMOR-1 TaxID=1365248 RepID=A0A167JXM4_9GAMM|nr:hypothetical protein [Pseudoalteromonas luteoviolacea]KZN61813.1 hypothetical protein N473_21740 [Pseudoalteromonas luteoviolacea CPMOR-1]
MKANKCWGRNKSLVACGRRGEWRLFCEDHKYQWLVALLFFIFTVVAGSASIYSVFSPDPVAHDQSSSLSNKVSGDSSSSPIKESENVPGFNNVEKQLNRAKIEGLEYTQASSSTFVAKLFVKSSLEEVIYGGDALFAFTSVTPVKSINEEYVFEAGKCRFIGKGKEFYIDRGYSRIDIKLINCVDDSRNSFGIDAEQLGLHRIGYLSMAGKPGNPNVRFIADGNIHTLETNINYLINMDVPITSLPKNGKSFERW